MTDSCRSVAQYFDGYQTSIESRIVTGSRTARFRAEKDKAREENPKEFTKRK
ncbi:MAG: hypothetical protein K2H43_03385 [Clostridia bacterium]|nr:hypothetical protein [Clostridia bacterium]